MMIMIVMRHDDKCDDDEAKHDDNGDVDKT